MYSGEFERIGKRFLPSIWWEEISEISVPASDEEGFFIKKTGTYLDSPEEPVYVPLDGDVTIHRIK